MTTTTTSRRRPPPSSSHSLVEEEEESTSLQQGAIQAAAAAAATVVVRVATPTTEQQQQQQQSGQQRQQQPKTTNTQRTFQNLLLSIILLFCVIQICIVEFGDHNQNDEGGDTDLHHRRRGRGRARGLAKDTATRIRGRTTAAAARGGGGADTAGATVVAGTSLNGSNSNAAIRKRNNNDDNNKLSMSTASDSVSSSSSSRVSIQSSSLSLLYHEERQRPRQRRRRKRRLVILGGPHKSASSSTQEFFFRYATGGQVVDSRRRSSSTTKPNTNANTTSTGENQENSNVNNRSNNNDHDIQLRTVLKDWIWPYHPKVQRYTSRKAFAILVKEMPQFSSSKLSPTTVDVGFIKEQQKKAKMTENVYKSIETSIFTQYPTANVILGSEEFDRFGTTPYSHRQGLKAMSNLIERISSSSPDRQEKVAANITDKTTTTTADGAGASSVADDDTTTASSSSSFSSWDVDVVIAYRRPRSDHWFSIWREIAPRSSKKMVGNGEAATAATTLQPYRQWICPSSSSSTTNSIASSSSSMLYNVDPYHDLELWEYLDSVANPLGYILAVLEHDSSFRVHMMDMAGMEDRHIDISHGIVCQILLDDDHDNDGGGGGLDSSDNVKNGRNQNDGGKLKQTLGTPFSCQGTNDGEGHATRIDDPAVFNNSNKSSTTVVVRANQKSGDPGLTDEQNDELEFLLRMRDCQYRQKLEPFIESGRLIVHFGDSIWDGCHDFADDTRNDIERSQQQQPWNVSSTDDLLYLMQDQAGCYDDTSSTTQKRQLTMNAVREYRNDLATTNG